MKNYVGQIFMRFVFGLTCTCMQVQVSSSAQHDGLAMTCGIMVNFGR